MTRCGHFNVILATSPKQVISSSHESSSERWPLAMWRAQRISAGAVHDIQTNITTTTTTNNNNNHTNNNNDNNKNNYQLSLLTPALLPEGFPDPCFVSTHLHGCKHASQVPANPWTTNLELRGFDPSIFLLHKGWNSKKSRLIDSQHVDWP